MREPSSLLVATKDVDVWCIAQGNNGGIPPAAKFSCDKKLTGVSSKTFVPKLLDF